MHVSGEHAFFAEDQYTKAGIAAVDESCPEVPPDVVLSVVIPGKAPFDRELSFKPAGAAHE
jgi:hypothetical protein